MCAVRYLNTVPLVWGMLHGEQRDLFDLSFTVPAECADRLEAGAADIGIVPAIALRRLGLETIPGAGIVSHGPVRSILLTAKKPFSQIKTLAADSGSRTSVALARILLAELHGAIPRVVPMAPELDAMLGAADAALVIGDAALAIDPAVLPYEVADLGDEWNRLTGLPMVFAVWAARPSVPWQSLEAAFHGSSRFGLQHIEEIIQQESASRGISGDLARAYLTQHIHFEIGNNELRGLELFNEFAQRVDNFSLTGRVPA